MEKQIKILNEKQKVRLDAYFIDADWSYRFMNKIYDYAVSIIEDDGFLDTELLNQYESMFMG